MVSRRSATPRAVARRSVARRLFALPTAAVLLGLALAGCANSGPSAGPDVQPVSPSPSVIEVPPAGGKPSAGVSGPTAEGAEQISGTVAAGVEPGCLVLQDYLLVFDDPALKADAPVGSKVTVTGRSEPGMMTTCQQGTPFVVTSVTPG